MRKDKQGYLAAMSGVFGYLVENDPAVVAEVVEIW